MDREQDERFSGRFVASTGVNYRYTLFWEDLRLFCGIFRRAYCAVLLGVAVQCCGRDPTGASLFALLLKEGLCSLVQ